MPQTRSPPTPWHDYAAILDSLVDAVLVIDPSLHLVYLNAEAEKRYGGLNLAAGAPRTCYAMTHGAEAPCYEAGMACPVRTVFRTGAPASAIHYHRNAAGTLVPEEIGAVPLRDGQGRVSFVVETVRSAAELLASKEVLDHMRDQLDLLRGILPTCAECKRIRTPEGTWEEMESYVGRHSAAEFSHGLCPHCVAALYPTFDAGTGRNRRGTP